MALDEAALNALGEDPHAAGILRFYRWEEATLSLGYFQKWAEREAHAASRGCPAVRRASGGGAIVHDREWTYSLTLPATHPAVGGHLASDRLYREVHLALIDVLSSWGLRAALCQAPPVRPRREEPFLCFQRRADGDLLLGEHKVGGSAQRRRKGAVLQHGSILFERSPSAPELPGICDLATAGAGDRDSLQPLLEAFLASAIEHIAIRLDLDLAESGWSERELQAAQTAAREIFDNAAWNQRR